MKRVTRLLLACLLLLGAVQASSMTTIQLRNRPADEVIPIVEPMLGAGDAISGHGYKIFLRASPQTQDEVREMIDAIDIAARMLQISVFQGSRQELDSLTLGGSLAIESGDANIRIGSESPDGAGSINYENGSVSASGSAQGTRLRRSSSPVHRLNVAEGNRGFIQAGAQRPYYGGDGSTVFQDVTTGFYVLPRVNGGRVTLQVSPFKKNLASSRGGTIETQSADTVISGRLGEWLPIGGIDEQSSRSSSAIGRSGSSDSQRSDRIWIKAELVR